MKTVKKFYVAAADRWSAKHVASVLKSAGHEVVARDRVDAVADDPVLTRIDRLGYDQLWLVAVDVGEGLSVEEADAIARFRESGGGVLTARDHHPRRAGSGHHPGDQ